MIISFGRILLHIFVFHYYFLFNEAQYSVYSSENNESSNGNCNKEGVCNEIKEVTAFMVGDHLNGKKVEISLDICQPFSKVEEHIGSAFAKACPQQTPCSVYSEVGNYLSNCLDIEDHSMVVLVPQGKLFMWPTVEVGRIREVPHVQSPLDEEVIQVETLSISPKIFRLHHFFSHEEADTLIKEATEQGTWTNDSLNAQEFGRTRSSLFLEESEVAVAIKDRAVDILGIPFYKESWVDGLQILRYEKGQAYNLHTDPFEFDSVDGEHNYDTTNKGTNRYASFLLYLGDVEEGGETVFSMLPPNSSSRTAPRSLEWCLRDVRKKGLPDIFEEDSWEEQLFAVCKHRFVVKPQKGDAILFYNLLPEGKEDFYAEHGSCPVISGIKWAANIWIWNGPRTGCTAVMEDGSVIDIWDPQQKQVVFRNYDIENAQLYWEDTFFCELPINEDVGENSNMGHTWNVRVNRKTVIKTLRVPYQSHYYDGFQSLEIHIQQNKEVRFIPKN